MFFSFQKVNIKFVWTVDFVILKRNLSDSVCQIIMEYLLQRGGKMPYSDESSAMLIKDKFNISKAAFKRALGHLMKSRLVVQEDGWTLLTETGKQWTPNSQEV